MKYKIIYEKYFSNDEKKQIKKFVEENINDFEKGENFVDVSNVIKRTSWITVEVN